jgi:hypothetical protein
MDSTQKDTSMLKRVVFIFTLRNRRTTTIRHANASLNRNSSRVEGDKRTETHRAAEILLRCFGRSDEWHVDVPQRITEKPFATLGRRIV